jgi:hypothetical protein
MKVTTLTRIYADRLQNTPNRRHKIRGRAGFTFSYMRWIIAETALSPDFIRVCPVPIANPAKIIGQDLAIRGSVKRCTINLQETSDGVYLLFFSQLGSLRCEMTFYTAAAMPVTLTLLPPEGLVKFFEQTENSGICRWLIKIISLISH